MNRPYVIVNCAMSADGKIALPTKKQIRISSEEDMKRVFHLRNECDAILVGVGAVLADNPKLTVKESYVDHPIQPVRVVLDTKAQTPNDALVVNSMARTILFVGKGYEKKRMYPENVDVLPSILDKEGFIDLEYMLNVLYEKGIRTLLVEGGGTILWNFINYRLVDDIFVYIGPLIIGGDVTPTMADGSGAHRKCNVISLVILDISRVGEGVLIHYQIQ